MLQFKSRNGLKKPLLLSVAVAVLTAGLVTPVVQANSYNARINELRNQNRQAASAKAQLQQSADSLIGVIEGLKSEIYALEQSIAANVAKGEKIKTDIYNTEQELARQRALLGESIRKMYIDSGMSTVEMLATSNNLSHFLDKEQYQVSLQNDIKDTLDHIKKLQQQLAAQKAETDKLLADQMAMQERIQAQRIEQDRLLALNQAQQNEYNQSIRANNSKIASLRAQQAAENARHFVGRVSKGGTGGYPYANAPFPNSLVDPWGMYKRQCVSYTAWKVANSGRHMPYWGGHGNAKQWDDNARADGIPVDGNPRVGDVAVSNSGTYGHVMYVEAVHGDGTITVSQYNAGWDGEYSVGKRSTAGLVFIHF